MQPVVEQIAKEYKARLLDIYGSELVELILYGSYARGDFREDSDIDFAVVLRKKDIHPSAEIEKTTPAASKLSLKYGKILSTLPVSWYKKQTSMQGIYREIRKEGIAI